MPHATKLTAEQAGALALQLANEKAQTLYNCQPFRNGQPAELAHGKWLWHDRRTQGHLSILRPPLGLPWMAHIPMLRSPLRTAAQVAPGSNQPGGQDQVFMEKGSDPNGP